MWPHSSSAVPATATSATPGWPRRTASTGSGHTFSPPVMIEVAAPAVDVRAARRPATGRGRRWRTSRRSGDRCRRGRPAAASGRGGGSRRRRRSAPRRRRAAGRRRRRRCRSRSCRRSSRRSAGGRPVGRRRRARSCGTPPDRCGAGRSPPARRASPPTPSPPPGRSRRGRSGRRPGDHRPGDDGQAADVGQRQAGQPVVVGPTPRRSVRGTRRCVDGVVGEHDALRRAGRPTGRHDERVAGLDGAAAVEGRRARRRRRSPPAPSPPAARPGRWRAGVGRPGRRRRRRPTPAAARRRTGPARQVESDEAGGHVTRGGRGRSG